MSLRARSSARHGEQGKGRGNPTPSRPSPLGGSETRLYERVKVGIGKGSFVQGRFLLLLCFAIAALVMVFGPMKNLLDSAARGDYYSHIPLIPLVTVYLIFQKRKEIFSEANPVYPSGALLSGVGGALYAFGSTQSGSLNQNDYVSLLTFSTIVFWAGGFLLLYGLKGFQKASFPILFLVFTIPIPNEFMGKIIYSLQIGSTEASEILFTLTGVPFQREEFVFHLPGISVQVAEVCSGIRSSLALFITSVLAGHFFLDRFWKKTVLALIVFPVTVFKNGVRIVTISLLANYVDQRFLTGSFLHQSGGFVFFIPALGLLALSLLWLRKVGNGIGRKA